MHKKRQTEYVCDDQKRNITQLLDSWHMKMCESEFISLQLSQVLLTFRLHSGYFMLRMSPIYAALVHRSITFIITNFIVVKRTTTQLTS